MTAEQYRYPYLDSSVFIAWLKGEVVKDVDRELRYSSVLGRRTQRCKSSSDQMRGAKSDRPDEARLGKRQRSKRMSSGVEMPEISLHVAHSTGGVV